MILVLIDSLIILVLVRDDWCAIAGKHCCVYNLFFILPLPAAVPFGSGSVIYR